MFSVLLSAGHGGKYRSNRGPTGYIEADGVLDVALRVEKHLKPYPIKVSQIRRVDKTVELSERAKIANNGNFDLVIDIHTNAGNGKALGTTTYYGIRDAKAKKLAEYVQKHVVKECGTKDRGIKTRLNSAGNDDYYYMLRAINIPSIIVEGEFHDNVVGEAKLKTASFRDKYALGIAKGILEYFGIKWIGNQEAKPVRVIGKATISVSVANIRNKPSLKDSVVIAQGKRGQVFDILEKADDFYLIQLPSGSSAYIHNSVITYKPLNDEVAPKGKYYRVQLGAFTNKSNAEQLAEQAKKKGFDAYIKLD